MVFLIPHGGLAGAKLLGTFNITEPRDGGRERMGRAAICLLDLRCVTRILKNLALLIFIAVAASALSPDELTLLQDSGGWRYMAITDADNGFETHHVCFDPKTPGTCSGNLLFRTDMTFKKSMKVHGQSVDRGGTYQVDGNSILFFDEFNHKDGPYTLELNRETKTLVLEMVEAGVHFRMELLEEKEFHRRQDRQGKSGSKPGGGAN